MAAKGEGVEEVLEDQWEEVRTYGSKRGRGWGGKDDTTYTTHGRIKQEFGCVVS